MDATKKTDKLQVFKCDFKIGFLLSCLLYIVDKNTSTVLHFWTKCKLSIKYETLKSGPQNLVLLTNY